jgi:hypothetical protein
MPINRILIALVLSNLFTSNVHAEREWTSLDGKFKVKAELVDYSEDDIRLRNDEGKVIRVPLAKLKKKDVEFVRNNKLAMYRYGDVLQVQNAKAGWGWTVDSRQKAGGVEVFVIKTDEDPTKGMVILVGQPFSKNMTNPTPLQKLGLSQLFAKSTLEQYAGAGLNFQMSAAPNMEGDEKSPAGTLAGTMTRTDGEQIHFRLRTIIFEGIVFHVSVLSPNAEVVDELLEVYKTIVLLNDKVKK